MENDDLKYKVTLFACDKNGLIAYLQTNKQKYFVQNSVFYVEEHVSYKNIVFELKCNLQRPCRKGNYEQNLNKEITKGVPTSDFSTFILFKETLTLESKFWMAIQVIFFIIVVIKLIF